VQLVEVLDGLFAQPPVAAFQAAEVTSNELG
jgi:hypothetical protein